VAGFDLESRGERLTDDDLLLMYRNGDVDAFDALFDRHHAAVYSFARTMLGDSLGPEEMLQEAFLTVARQAKKYEPRGRFRPWLMRIVRNRCLNRLAAVKARREMLAGSGMTLIEPASREPGPGEKAREDEQAATVRAAIAELPERQREAIALQVYSRMSYREIAKVLEMPINTVKTLIHRAKASLAQSLGSLNEE